MIRNDTVFTLERDSKPKLTDSNKEVVQAEAVYGFPGPYGSNRSLEQLIEITRYRRYETLFKTPTSTTIRDSLIHHLKEFKKKGFVRIVEGQAQGRVRVPISR
jgi:hypothetical protein